MRLPGCLASPRRIALAVVTGGLLTGGSLSTLGVPAASAASAATAAPARTAAVATHSSRVTPATPATLASLDPGAIHAAGAAVENTATGRILWSRGLGTRRPVGSITKVMTALVVLREGNLNRELTVPAAAVSYVRAHGASSAGLHAGDKLTVRQLLAAMLLPSGCDAAYTLASAYGPGVTRFVARMNATARSLGLGHTYFNNPDGLPLPTEHSSWSTPGNLLVIGRAALAYSEFRAIVSQRTWRVTQAPGHHAYTWRTTNGLLGTYPGMIGIKTGFTQAAGYCLLFADQRRGTTLLGVVLDSSGLYRSQSFTDTEKILDWAFG